MIYLEIPIIKDAAKEYNKIQLQSYRLYSSLFEPTPKANFKYVSDYVMPDLLGLTIGSSFPIQYTANIPKDESNSVEKELDTSAKEEQDFTDPVDLAGLCVQDMVPESGVEGSLTVNVTCTGEFDFFQNSRIRKAYTKKYGDEVVDDVLESNRIMKAYERVINKTDNANTVYRTLGEADLDFVINDVAKNFLINAGKPIFYTSLDRKIYFTSINSILESTTKSKVVLELGVTNDAISQKMINNALKNFIDEDKATTLTTVKWKMHIGGKDTTFNIKNSIYFSDFENGTVSTSLTTFKPALKNQAYFPIDTFFMETAESTQAIATYNRPSTTIAFESKNYFDSFENLITLDAEITNIQNLNELVLAGDTITVLTPYPYSIYNGNYTVAAVEYGQETSTNFMKLKLIRANVDMTWIDSLTTDKSSEDFKFPFAPSINKNMYYSI